MILDSCGSEEVVREALLVPGEYTVEEEGFMVVKTQGFAVRGPHE